MHTSVYVVLPFHPSVKTAKVVVREANAREMVDIVHSGFVLDGRMVLK